MLLPVCTNLSAQEEGPGAIVGFGTSCQSHAIENLESCVGGNEISYTLSFSGGNVYLYAYGSFPPGQLNSCVSQYNAERNQCPDAPVLLTRSSGGKKY